MNSFCFKNAHIISESGIYKEDLFVENGKICSFLAHPQKVIDAKNLLLAPGLIDIQVNGACGVDFSSGDLRFDLVSKELLRSGVTSFLATIISRPHLFYKELFNNLPQEFTTCVGFHLEGPCLNKAYQGVHSEKALVCGGDIEDFFHPLVKMITLAPELSVSQTLIKKCLEKGIISCCGHSEATIQELESAKQNGLRSVTHLFNAMPSLHHRNPGIIGAVLGNHLLPYSLICDGVHIHPEVVRIAWRSYPQGLILTSDCNALLGCKETRATLGENLLTQNSSLVGSKVGLLSCVKNFILYTNCQLHEAFCAASLKPARLLGIDHYKGKLKPGYDADILLLSESLELQGVFIHGEDQFL